MHYIIFFSWHIHCIFISSLLCNHVVVKTTSCSHHSVSLMEYLESRSGPCLHHYVSAQNVTFMSRWYAKMTYIPCRTFHFCQLTTGFFCSSNQLIQFSNWIIAKFYLYLLQMCCLLATSEFNCTHNESDVLISLTT